MQRQSLRSVAGVVALLALAYGGLTASEATAEEVNATGTWQAVYHCEVGNCAGQEKSGVFMLQQAAGSSAVSGSLNVSGGGEGSVTGTLSGNTLSLEGTGSAGYTASGVETISPDGLSWSGTYKDSAGTSGELTATRPSLPVFPPTIAGAPSLRPSAIQVLCNYEVGGANFQCTAQVGDASGAAPAKIPSGTVAFSAPSGNFSPAPSCGLQPTPGSSNVASCAITYIPATKIPPGSQAPVTGSYSGDTTFAASAAKAGTGAVVSPIVSAAKSTGEGASTTVSCPATSPSCAIVLNLSVQEATGAVVARKVKRRKLTIGASKLTLEGGQKRRVAVSLNRAGKRLLARRRHFTALLTVSSDGTTIKIERVKIAAKRSGR